MKKERQKRIIEIIETSEISTQTELIEILNKENFNVTQATVSRDIRELKLIKKRGDNNSLIYAMPSSEKPEHNFERIIKNVDCAGNIAVIKCKSGSASAICAEIDAKKDENIVGTIAGDDTIFILFRNYIQAAEFKKKYQGE